MSLASGTKLGPYEVLGPLGAGGMGEVYRAHDTKLSREVAIKVLPAELADNPDALARFEREARAVAQLSHPNILAIYDFGQQGDVAYAAMELLEGETLREGLAHGALPARKVVDLAVQIANGLAAAHEKGIVHRDIKPENVFLIRDGHVKILDFGIAKVRGPALASSGKTLTTPPEGATGPGVVMGTVGYMSPEQVRGEAVDHRSDIFSFGAVLYEMLTGVRAFGRDTAAETMAAILKEEPPEMGSVPTGPSPALQRIVQHCLEKKPGERFQSARDVAFALQALSGSAVASGPSVPFTRRRHGATLAWVILAAVLALGAALAGWGFRGEPPPPPTFRRLTFFRGTLDRAAFANHGQTILYSARVDGQPSSLYSLSQGAAEPTRLGPPGTHLLSVSAGNDLLVLRNPQMLLSGNLGTLAQATQAGTGLREVAERVFEADWASDGQRFALARSSGAHVNTVLIEFPLGKQTYRSAGILSSLRISPDGKRLLFLENDWTPGAAKLLQILGLEGKVETLARGAQVGSAIWGPSGREVWLAEHEGDQTTLSKLALSGSRRTLWRGAGRFELQGVDGEGRLLASLQHAESQVETAGNDPAFPRNLSWLNSTFAFAFSRDGQTLLFTESGTGGASLDGIYLRRAGEPAPVRLGNGEGCDLSPDGRMVLGASAEGHYQIIPTGAGSVRNLDTGPGTGAAGWFFPDGHRLLLDKTLADGTSQMFVYDLEQGRARPAAPAEYTAFTGQRPLSPDGTRMALFTTDPRTSEHTFWIFPVDGEGRTRVEGISPREVLQAWSEDGKGLYVFERGPVPTQIDRVDIATGRREPWKVFVPADPAGIPRLTNFETTRDGKRVVFNYRRVLSQLFLVEGLK